MSPCSQNAFISDSKVFKINFKAEPMMQEELYIVLHQVLSAQFYNQSDDIQDLYRSFAISAVSVFIYIPDSLKEGCLKLAEGPKGGDAAQ